MNTSRSGRRGAGKGKGKGKDKDNGRDKDKVRQAFAGWIGLIGHKDGGGVDWRHDRCMWSVALWFALDARNGLAWLVLKSDDD